MKKKRKKLKRNNSKQRQDIKDIISLILPLFRKKKNQNPVTSYFGWGPIKSFPSCRMLRDEGKKKSESSYTRLIPGVCWQITLEFSTDVNYCRPYCRPQYHLKRPSSQRLFYATPLHFSCQG